MRRGGSSRDIGARHDATIVAGGVPHLCAGNEFLRPGQSRRLPRPHAPLAGSGAAARAGRIVAGLEKRSRVMSLREREIALNLQLLQILKDAAARPHPRILVELFDGARYELDVTSTVSRINDTAVIRGTLKPPARGDFTFVASGNLLIGTLQLGNRIYKTEHIANGRLKLLELDPDKMPPD